jgi:Tfp pilus assembly protein FimT
MFTFLHPTTVVNRPISHSRSSTFDDDRGFSMVEITIVCVYMAILVAVAVPNVIRQTQYYRLDKSVSLVSSKLAETRMNAIKRNQTCWLRVDKTARTVQIRTTSAGATVDIGYPDFIAQGTNLDASDSIEVAFDSLGRYSSGPQTVTILENNLTRRKDIGISPAGKITVSGMY